MTDPRGRLERIRRALTPAEWARFGGMVGAVVALHVAGWGMLAAAIDNTTRKLVGEGKRPLSVGFFFSLGHSSVVFILAVLLNFGIRGLDKQVRNDNSGLHTITGVVGTCGAGL